MFFVSRGAAPVGGGRTISHDIRVNKLRTSGGIPSGPDCLPTRPVRGLARPAPLGTIGRLRGRCKDTSYRRLVKQGVAATGVRGLDQANIKFLGVDRASALLETHQTRGEGGEALKSSDCLPGGARPFRPATSTISRCCLRAPFLRVADLARGGRLEGKRFLERGSVFWRGEVFSREGKRFLERGIVFSR